MPEIDDECTFATKADQVKFTTQTNGDQIIIKDLNLSQEQATSLTWLINSDDEHELEFQIKIKEV